MAPLRHTPQTGCVDTYKVFNHGLADMNGEQGATELPIPATYVLDPSGRVRLAFIDEDYTKRLDPAEILNALRGMRK
jgi:peroxiredoxin